MLSALILERLMLEMIVAISVMETTHRFTSNARGKLAMSALQCTRKGTTVDVLGAG
jgi:hypothetical protein